MSFPHIKIVAALWLASPAPLAAEQPETARLTKIAVYDQDGRMDPEATIGNILVESVGRTYQKYVVGKPAASAQASTKIAYCDTSGQRDLLQISVKEGLKKFTKADKARLRASDVALRRHLAVQMIGDLEDISPALIEQDEAIGPGVYHDSIAGMEYVLETCRYYGQL